MTTKEYMQKLARLYEQMDGELVINPPVTEDLLRQAEEELGFAIDKDLCAFWEAADGAGSSQPFFARPGYLTPYDFISIGEALKLRGRLAQLAPRYAGYQEPEPRDSRIRAEWFQSGWLPFASFAEGTLILLSDHSPAPSGTSGQIIGYVHDPDEIVYIADSFTAFLHQSIKALEADKDEFFSDIC